MSIDWIQGACAVPDARVRAAALARQGQLTKPPGALGRLEHLAVQLAAWQRNESPTVQRIWIAVYAADHGVAAEGVSAFPQAATGEMVRNFARGGAAIAVLARELGARLEVVNLGVVNDPGELPRVRRAWIAPSSANICEQPAMTSTQLRDALPQAPKALHRQGVAIRSCLSAAKWASATPLLLPRWLRAARSFRRPWPAPVPGWMPKASRTRRP